MKHLLYILMLFACFIGSQAPAIAVTEETTPFNYTIKHLYSAPSEESNLIYDIPIEVKLLDLSDDGNWYKVKIAFCLGPLGHTYVGWTHIPVGQILADRANKNAAAQKATAAPTEETE